MYESPISLKNLLRILLFALFVIFCLYIASILDPRTKIVFCDVGQGDGAYIRIKNKVDVLIDAGPDRKILDCLGKYMPFFDRTIELVILSHGQKDHIGGMLFVLNRYTVENLCINPLGNTSKTFQDLQTLIRGKKIPICNPVQGTVITVLNDSFKFLWPSQDVLNKLPTLKNQDDNYYSLIVRFQENGLSVLFTGDAPSGILNKLPKEANIASNILKIPHHGSKNSLSLNFLKLANPSLAVISVGKRNQYGHPSKGVLDTLQALGIKVRRTDEEGSIEIKLTE